MITIGAGIDTRLGALEHYEEGMLRPPESLSRARPGHREAGRLLGRVVRWAIRGYQQANATDLASAIAFQALVAVVPMFLLLISIAGLFLQDGKVLEEAILTIAWVLPPDASQDAFTAAFEARRNSGLFGALSLLGFAWVGTGFVSAMARSMNRVYGVRNAGYLKEKQRGFIVILLFALFFTISASASIVTTFFVGDRERLPLVFQRWFLADSQVQMLVYVISAFSAFALFMTVYRLVPNAKQRLLDVWPGAVVSSILFLIVTQAFPIYLRIVGGSNRYGVALGLLSLMVAAFYAIAHVILFGTYINATWQRQRRSRGRARQRSDRDRDLGTPHHDPFVPADVQKLQTEVLEHRIR
ncbi:MAG TPA: YihY/virulence factor BrkB family protein [Thermomicrobiales bacterium]|nr:YihY/virulence factor BrkB family protein [Thermomicrobiales bacterium]